MGDRCHLTMTIHPADLAKAIAQESEMRNLDEFSLERIEYQMEEVNYGATEDREKLAGAGVRFYGYHTEGGDYPGFEFFGDGETLWEWPTDGNGGYAINVTKDDSAPPTLNIHEISDCEKFLRVEQETRKLIDEAAKGWSPPADPWDELDQDALDEMVHQAWSEGASEINNQGRAKQVSWLKARGVAP